MLRWLAIASSLAAPGALIALPLFQELTRPSARYERDVILGLAETIGYTSLLKNVICYDTPLFEQEAFRSLNIHPGRNWRWADLLMIKARRQPSFHCLEYSWNQQEWDTFIVGTQVLRLRRRPRRQGDHFLLRPVNGTSSFVFDSVSARDPRRNFIDIWSSRNRVARVGDVRRIRHALSSVADHQNGYACRPEPVHHLASSPSGPANQCLSEFLCWDTTP